MLHVDHTDYQHAQMRCYLCPNVDDLVDTQVSIEGEGILAICRSCVKEMAATLAEDDPTADDEIERLTQLYTDSVEANDTLVRRERSLRGQLKALKTRMETKDDENAALTATNAQLRADFQAAVEAKARDIQTAANRRRS